MEGKPAAGGEGRVAGAGRGWWQIEDGEDNTGRANFFFVCDGVYQISVVR
jgi:hypothetical protein